MGEAPALPSAGPQLEQRLRLPRATWPPGSPVPQAYSSRHALGRSFLLSDPAGTPSPGRALPLRRPHGSVPGAAPALAQAPEPRWSREEEEERGPERQREVGQGGGVAGEGWETGRGTGEGQRDREKRGGAGQGVEEGRMLVRRRHRLRKERAVGQEKEAEKERRAMGWRMEVEEEQEGVGGRMEA